MCFFRHFMSKFGDRALKHELKRVVLQIDQYSTQRVYFHMDIEQVRT